MRSSSSVLLLVLAPVTALALQACAIDNGLSGIKDRQGADSDSDPFDIDTSSGDSDTPPDTDPRNCAEETFPGQAIDQAEECYDAGPPVGSFTPVLEWKKDSFSTVAGDANVMMMPAVGSLTDDDGDGDADADDVPDIVFITYGNSYPAGTLRVISGNGGAEILTIANQNVQGTGGVAIGDIDGDGWTDIVAPTTDYKLKMFDHTGALKWTSPSLSGHMYGTSDNPAISDMDGDGSPEVICGKAILDKRGQILGTGRSGMGGVSPNNVGTTSFAVDIDGDGQQEVVTGNALYNIDGSVKASNTQGDGYPAVGNFDSDANGEIVVVAGGRIRLQDDDMTVLCTASIPGASSSYYGGPPTIADFDGDGEAEFAAASGSKYTVFEKDCSVKWQANTQDASSGNTGSSVFDFEGDGSAEAVYADETKLWAFNGADGTVKLQSTQHSNGTWLEYPAIADVDADDHAEIVVANTGSKLGIYVFGDAGDSWMPGRKIWNQHAYSITNVDDNGGIPTVAAQNWLTYNNFRSGDLAPAGGYSGPDLFVSVKDVCTDECDRDKLYVWLQVANDGYEDVTDDFDVELYGVMDSGEERLLDSQTVTDTVPAATSMDSIAIVVDPVPNTLASIYAKVDKGNNAASGVVGECIEDNNEDTYTENLCPE